jgi:transposase
MEDVLDLYAEAHDPKRPVVCFDEKPIQLLEETRQPRPVAPGQPALIDYEYRRKGTANIFMAVEPLAGWRQVTVTERRTKLDFAAQLKLLSDHYPDAERVRIVMDNLNTHTLACLYEAFGPDEARRIASRLEIHYTPKHGSWLNMAEAELSVLSNQCLDRRIGEQEALAKEVDAWTMSRNREQVGIRWRFTIHDARRKLAHLYPVQP